MVGKIGRLQFRVPAFSSRTLFSFGGGRSFWLVGRFGQPNVSWGDFARFGDYTSKLIWFLPHATIPALAVRATGAEIRIGLLLLAGRQTRITAQCSGILLITFGLAVTLALGIKSPLNLSVFSAPGVLAPGGLTGVSTRRG
jgi:hypothetical protein